MDKSMRSLLSNPYQTALFTPLSITSRWSVTVGSERG